MIEKSLECGEGFAVTNAYEIEDRKRLRKLMEKEIREGKYTQEFFDAIDKTYKDCARDIKQFWKLDHSQSSPEDLIGYFDRFFHIYVTTIHPMVLAIYASDLQDIFEAELKKVLKKDSSQEELMGTLSLLLTPTRLTQVQKEEQVLLELQRDFESSVPATSREAFESYVNKPVAQRVLKELEEHYGFFHMEYIGEPKLADEYKELLWTRVEETRGSEEWKNQLSPRERLQQIISEQQRFFEEHTCSGFFHDLVFAMQEFLIVLDYSKADLVEGIYYARPLLDELGKRLGLGDWIGIRYLLPDELKDALRDGKKFDETYIADRRKRFAFVLQDMTIAPYFGEDAVRIVDELLQKDNPGNVKEFKGLTAFPGKVRGVACIVTGAQDRDKFQQGQIMVTRDTTTELTSIIKKASAIIADQGSMLSHTAIVSREFKIPCLVQTKFGTKVVKDGDEIEVDASNGIVRILS